MGSVNHKQMKPLDNGTKHREKYVFDTPLFKRRSTVTILEPLSKGYTNSVQSEIPITNHQSQLIIESWSTIGDYKEFGRNIFFEIFLIKPNLKRLFQLERYNDTNILETERFRCHSANFGKFLEIVVGGLKQGLENSDDPDTTEGHQRIIKTASAVGGAHIRYTKGIKFDTDYWRLFVCAVVSQLRPYLMTSKLSQAAQLETENAWTILIEFIVEKMKNSYLRMLQDEYNKLTVQMQVWEANLESRTSYLGDVSGTPPETPVNGTPSETNVNGTPTALSVPRTTKMGDVRLQASKFVK